MLRYRAIEFYPIMLWGTTAVLVMVLVGMWHHKRRRNSYPPRKWKSVGQLSHLTLFPLKSCAGITLQEADCTEYGIQTTGDSPLKLRDRFFIVYDAKTGEFKTARTYPKMVLIHLAQDGDDAVLLTAPNMPPLKVKIPQISENGKCTYCTMFEAEVVEVADCGDEAAVWLSKYIFDQGEKLRLGYYLENIMPKRTVATKFKECFKTLENKDLGVYSDLSSFMLMTESSVDDLKTKLPPNISITPRQFRPNFLVQGTAPYEEDNWEWIRIGETAIFRNVKPCTRCVFITIDPDKGVMEPKREPLRTLKGYRQLQDPVARKVEGSAPAFGINLGLYHVGTVRVGDVVYIGDD